MLRHGLERPVIIRISYLLGGLNICLGGSPPIDSLTDVVPDLPGSDARRRVAIERCKPCASPHASGDMPKYLPAGLTQYPINTLTEAHNLRSSVDSDHLPLQTGFEKTERKSTPISKKGAC